MDSSRKPLCGWFVLIGLLLGGLGCGCDSRTPAVQGARQVEHESGAERPRRVRAPAVAGLFYPAEKRALSDMIDKLLAEAPAHSLPHLRGLICPHAGYTYSGLTAASAYHTLAGRGIHTVVILGPSHYAAFRGASVSGADAYQTPLGLVPVSGKGRQLVKTRPFVLERRCRVQRPGWWTQASKPAPLLGEDTPHTWEHSIEVQIPFLQKCLKRFEILPIVFGEADPELAARALAGMMDDKTVVVASSDLSHYHPYDVAKELDKRCIQAILDLEIDQMKTQEACGKTPILTLMHLARLKGWKPKLLGYQNSGDVSGDKSGVVGYTAMAFYEPGTENVAGPERTFLLNLARTTLTRVVTNGSLPEVNVQDVPVRLRERKACFVTLTKQGALRGCIGHILPQEALYQAVIDNAQNAAIRDWRFTPVQPSEVDEIKIEISVLTVPQPLRFNSPDDLLGQLQPYEHGVLLQIGPHSATFLPQVWQQIPDKAEFMDRLAQKAGCAPSAWKGDGASVSTYQVEAFTE